MMNLLIRLGLVEPPPPPDPLTRIANTVEASAWQQTSELSNLHAQISNMNQAMHSYHAAIVALQAEQKRLQDRVTDLEDDVARQQYRMEHP